MFKNIHGVYWENRCTVCQSVIVAEGGVYEPTEYVEFEGDLVCEHCWYNYFREWFDENAVTDKLGFDEDVVPYDASGRF